MLRVKTSVMCVVVLLVVSVIGVAVSITVDDELQEDEPVEIYDWHDLDAVRDDLDGDYVLMNDLDEDTAGYEEYVDTDDGWLPIGDDDEPFTGEFNGDVFSISDLKVNRSSTDYVGLFGYTEDANLTNVSLVDVDVIGDERVGGLVGRNRGTVENSYATGNVTGDRNVGGLVGVNGGTVSNSYATGNVTGDRNVGGLVGVNGGTVSNSYATGNVSGYSHVGGLVGENAGGTVENSYATANVDGTFGVGGLVGNGGTIENSYATGTVSGTEHSNDVGGLVGRMFGFGGKVSNSYATGTVSGEWSVGGLVGSNTEDVIVSHSYATGNVSGGGIVGGLVGSNDGTVEDSFWDTETTGQDESDGGTGKTTQEMIDVATYTDTNTEGLDDPWDFIDDPYDDEGDEDIWDIDEEINDGYPFFVWDHYKILDVTIDGEGTVDLDPEQEYHWPESQVDLTAIADEGWEFVEWTGDHEGTENDITITMYDDKELTAYFEIKTYELTVDTVGEGTVDIEPEKEEYEHGEEVHLTALPDEGHEFIEWDGTDETGEEITISMYDDKELTAHFEIKTYDLTVDTVGEGTVDIEPEKEEYEHGEEVNLTALPDEGHEFVEWFYVHPTPNTIRMPDEGHEFVEWDGTDETGEEITITMYEYKELIALFQIKTYSAEIDIEGEGSVEIDPEQDEYEHGEEIELTPEPEEGWEFDHWVINGEVYEEENIEIEMYEDIDITVHFEEEGIGLSIYLVLAVLVAVIILVSVLLMKRGKTGYPETEDEYLDEDLSEDI